MRAQPTFIRRALVNMMVLCAVIENVEGWKKEMIAFTESNMENTVTRNGSLYNESVGSTGECTMICMSVNSCVSFYFNSISRECLLHDTIYQPSLANITELNWKYFNIFDYRDLWWYFQDHTYFVPVTFVRTWEEAKVFCKGIGWHLAHIDTPEEQTWLSSKFIEDGIIVAWTGLNDLAEEGQYIWDDDNTGPAFDNWGENEPTGFPDRCVVVLMLGPNGLWYDGPCNVPLPFICEK